MMWGMVFIKFMIFCAHALRSAAVIKIYNEPTDLACFQYDAESNKIIQGRESMPLTNKFRFVKGAPLNVNQPVAGLTRVIFWSVLMLLRFPVKIDQPVKSLIFDSKMAILLHNSSR